MKMMKTIQKESTLALGLALLSPLLVSLAQRHADIREDVVSKTITLNVEIRWQDYTTQTQTDKQNTHTWSHRCYSCAVASAEALKI